MITDIHDYVFSTEKAIQYLQDQKLEHILISGRSEELQPKWEDLARLHKLVRSRKPFQILEFGSGYSTLIMAIALKQNWDEYLIRMKGNGVKLKYRIPNLISIESADIWKHNTVDKIKKNDLDDFVNVIISGVSITERSGNICHVYDNLPDITPDFIYLDGPDPNTVTGSINGLSFQNGQRTVMSADLLMYESTLLPGFFMIIDGRTNNSRFLQRNLQRNYRIQHDIDSDITFFELEEQRLGRKNVFGFEAY